MKRFGKIALGAVMLAGAAAAMTTPASAAVGVTLGVSPSYYGPPAGAVCDPYSRFYDPYYCNGYYGYYGPSVAIGGYWGGGYWRGGHYYGGFHRR
jgi:hypothetical protein